MNALTQPCQPQGRSVMPNFRRSHPFTFVVPHEFLPQRLAYMLDSFVRVTRLVEQSRFTNDCNKTVDPNPPNPIAHATDLSEDLHLEPAGEPKNNLPNKLEILLFPGTEPLQVWNVYNIQWPKPPNYLPLPLLKQPEPTLIRKVEEYYLPQPRPLHLLTC